MVNLVGCEPSITLVARLGYSGEVNLILGIEFLKLLGSEVIVNVNITQVVVISTVLGESCDDIIAELILECSGIVSVKLLLVPLGGSVPYYRSQRAACCKRVSQDILVSVPLGLAVLILLHALAAAHCVACSNRLGVRQRACELAGSRSLLTTGYHSPSLGVVDLLISSSIILSLESGIAAGLNEH